MVVDYILLGFVVLFVLCLLVGSVGWEDGHLELVGVRVIGCEVGESLTDDLGSGNTSERLR